MKIYKITDGYADCWVVAMSENNALKLDNVKEYFADSYEDVTARELPDDELLKINFEFYRKGSEQIELLAEKWAGIYGDRGEEIICQSEY